MKKTICLLYGGKSQEHEVSCQSAASVYRHIDRSKYNVICVGIARDGTWHRQERPDIASEPARGDLLRIHRNVHELSLVPGKGFRQDGRLLPVDFVFPVLHGPFGEDGTLQGLLEMLSLPYAGAGVLGSALAMDKELAKCVWRDRDIPIVDFLTVRAHEHTDSESHSDLLELIEKRFGWPVFVKPSGAGSSVGVSKAADREECQRALARAWRYDTKAIVERALDVREIECAVIGNGPVESFPPGEIIPTHDFYSYEAKYLDPAGARPAIPADLPPGLMAQARSLAERAYLAVGAEGFARVDLFLEKGTLQFFVNEINSLPGFTHISMFPRLCEAGGLPFSRLIDRLIEYGFTRARVRAGLDFRFTDASRNEQTD